MIKTKEDFRGKYINLPKNISEKKLCTIKDKFKKLGLDLQIKGRKKHGYDVQVILNPRGELKYYFGTEEFLRDTFTKISIKEFLKEEETIDYNLHNIGDKRYKVIQLENYNCIPNNYLVFYGTDLREIKEDVERTIQGFSFGKPKIFDNAFQGLDWCFRNLMKEIEVFNTVYEQTYKVRYNNTEKVIEWFGKYDKGYGIIEYKWRELKNIDYIYNWKNIKELRPMKEMLSEAIKKGLRFKFQDETWRKSPQGFVLDSKGNSLKSTILLSNLKTKVLILNEQ